MENGNFIKQKIDELQTKLAMSAATFIYKPNELNNIKNQIFELQNKCEHKFENGKCIYCKKKED